MYRTRHTTARISTNWDLKDSRWWLSSKIDTQYFSIRFNEFHSRTSAQTSLDPGTLCTLINLSCTKRWSIYYIVNSIRFITLYNPDNYNSCNNRDNLPTQEPIACANRASVVVGFGGSRLTYRIKSRVRECAYTRSTGRTGSYTRRINSECVNFAQIHITTPIIAVAMQCFTTSALQIYYY